MTVAPMRSPVKEPGPDMKVISVMSCQVLWFSVSFCCKKYNSFSAISRLRFLRYSRSFSFKMTSGVEVSRYNRTASFLTRFVALVWGDETALSGELIKLNFCPLCCSVVTVLFANSLLVSRKMFRRALF